MKRRILALAAGVLTLSSCGMVDAVRSDSPDTANSSPAFEATETPAADGKDASDSSDAPADGASASPSADAPDGASPSPSADSTDGSGPSDSASPSASEQPTRDRIILPAEAYRGAGGDVPASAKPMTNVEGDDPALQIARVRAPSGNIWCDIDPKNGAVCTVKEITGKAPNQSIVIKPGGEPEFTDSGAVTNDDAAVAAQEMPYGTQASHGEFVCASETNGMTCWSTKSGHGVFLNRDGITTF
ncbi:hypothetical protein [Helcobacillus massiliensis]|uniref:Uncharacterized protein n=1 Tax=Helcobacillus massiliensis TaxID=521392 RepID=A0A839QWJ5_9MICO|nr:hypothetical protein [Helcobacillus massiliensis]MBB3024008.1 hypothetical protein [Helcobacillus massiliensis]